jgi:hypothetical protein
MGWSWHDEQSTPSDILSVIVTPEYADAHNATEDEFDMVVCCERLWQKLCDHAESNL